MKTNTPTLHDCQMVKLNTVQKGLKLTLPLLGRRLNILNAPVRILESAKRLRSPAIIQAKNKRANKFSKSWLDAIALDTQSLLASSAGGGYDCCLSPGTSAYGSSIGPLTDAESTVVHSTPSVVYGYLWAGVWASMGNPVADGDDSSCGLVNYLNIHFGVTTTGSNSNPGTISNYECHGNCSLKIQSNAYYLSICFDDGDTSCGNSVESASVSCGLDSDGNVMVEVDTSCTHFGNTYYSSAQVTFS